MNVHRYLVVSGYTFSFEEYLHQNYFRVFIQIGYRDIIGLGSKWLLTDNTTLNYKNFNLLMGLQPHIRKPGSDIFFPFLILCAQVINSF